jgi:hypothetical protein
MRLKADSPLKNPFWIEDIEETILWTVTFCKCFDIEIVSMDCRELY